jgi:response regulator RpfG family c-di-GMP phosphodiesterase
MNEKVLLVDDDFNILAAYSRRLRGKYKFFTAESGKRGLAIIKENGPFAVVVTDFRMPAMDGVQFLAQVKQISPDTVRIMLTGQADMQSAIDAVNKGNVFRFLTKPCPTGDFISVLDLALEQYRLITAERVLLDKTLKGSIRMLIDILTIVNPVAFSQSSRLRSKARRLAILLGLEKTWEIELAAMLSQIGCVTIPGEILEKRLLGEKLTESENEIFLSHPQAGRALLDNIPRLGGIAEAIACQMKQYDGGGYPKDNRKGADIPIAARILKVVTDLDSLESSGETTLESIEIMRKQKQFYDPSIFAVLESHFSDVTKAGSKYLPGRKAVNAAEAVNKPIMKEINLRELYDVDTGTVIAEDIMTRTGVMIVPKGQEITEALKLRLENFRRFNMLKGSIMVFD